MRRQPQSSQFAPVLERKLPDPVRENFIGLRLVVGPLGTLDFDLSEKRRPVKGVGAEKLFFTSVLRPDLVEIGLEPLSHLAKGGPHNLGALGAECGADMFGKRRRWPRLAQGMDRVPAQDPAGEEKVRADRSNQYQRYEIPPLP